MKGLILMPLFLMGCAGNTHYTLKPIETRSGEIVCCEAIVNNSKDYDSLIFNFKKKKDGTIEVSLDEKGVKTNAAVAAENQGKLLDVVKSIIPEVK